MEYVVGSVAALVSGNVTPNRPKHLRRALTPTKHRASPNVTPKSEIADRSIFLSPTLQKKKAIVKKSPKRIFANPDLDVTDDTSLISPKADKVKKHLKIELDSNTSVNLSLLSPESLQDNIEMLNKTPKKNKKSMINKIGTENENTPTKSKKRKSTENFMTVMSIDTNPSPTKKQKKMKPLSQSSDNLNPKNLKSADIPVAEVVKTKKHKKKQKAVAAEAKGTDQSNSPNKQTKKDNLKLQESVVQNITKSPKKQKKRYKGKKNKNQSNIVNESKAVPTKVTEPDEELSDSEDEDHVNPNAITKADTDSEHDSDDNVESENDEANKKALEPEESSDEEDKEEVKKEKTEEKKREPLTDDEIKRTIFVGNVPFNKKCKKEIKKIFSEFGTIETVRIRTVPVKDASVTPKMAIIKSDLHPDRSTVNVYVKFANAASAEKALSANNTVLNERHLRVTRSDTTGSLHDPKCAVFVGNIPFALEDETLRAKFEKCGKIDSVRIVRDRKTNAGKGFGYVNFASKDGVELALALSEEDLTIKNRILRVKRCTLTEQKNRAKRPTKGFPAAANQSRKFPPGQKNENTGASRRIAKRQKDEKCDGGPPNKRPRGINQPREKKERKEFVGMTAEKKKKNKFDKGQKKKKAISEILTKKS